MMKQHRSQKENVKLEQIKINIYKYIKKTDYGNV